MMHEWFELTIAQVLGLDTEEFLELCSKYLEETLREEERADVDRQAAAYACQYLGICNEVGGPLD